MLSCKQQKRILGEHWGHRQLIVMRHKLFVRLSPLGLFGLWRHLLSLRLRVRGFWWFCYVIDVLMCSWSHDSFTCNDYQFFIFLINVHVLHWIWICVNGASSLCKCIKSIRILKKRRRVNVVLGFCELKLYSLIMVWFAHPKLCCGVFQTSQKANPLEVVDLAIWNLDLCKSYNYWQRNHVVNRLS